MRKFLGLFLFTFLTVSLAFGAQTTEIKSTKSVKMQKDTSFANNKGNSHYVIDCSATTFFADRPGNHKPYMNNSDYYTTICANDSKKGVTIMFQQFAIEKFDKLTVWDESRTKPVTAETTPEKMKSTKIGTYTGHSSPGMLVSKKGCLTFRFQSDATVVKTGWYGRLGCANKPVKDPCVDFNKLVTSEIKCGVTIKSDNLKGKNTYELYGTCIKKSCPAKGRELIYKFVNRKPSDLKITLKEHNGTQPKVLNLIVLNDCKPDACIAALPRPAENAMQHVNSVTIKDAKAGIYYIVVDANQAYRRASFELSVECTGGSVATCSNPSYYEDFESYRPGSRITKVNNHWFKSDAIGLRDAKVSSDRASNGKNSLEFNRQEEATQDVFLDLGDEFRGVYRICFDMYIEPHSTAFFGLFGGDNSDPWGTVSKEFGHKNGMEGRWFDVELFVDLDRNRYALFIDNRHKVTTGSYMLNLDKLNFYGLPKAHFYIDRLCFGRVSRIPSTSASARVVNLTEPLTTLTDKEEQQVLTPFFAETSESTATDLEVAASISDLKAGDLTVSPNPTRGMTNIALKLDVEQQINLQIFSQTGQLVRSLPLGSTQFVNQEMDLSDLPNGLYLLRATGEQSVVTKKIILQQ